MRERSVRWCVGDGEVEIARRTNIDGLRSAFGQTRMGSTFVLSRSLHILQIQIAGMEIFIHKFWGSLTSCVVRFLTLRLVTQ